MHALLGRLLDESHELAPREIGPLLERELGALGFADVGIFLADHEQRKLVPIAPWSDREPHRIDSTLPGRVYQAARSAKVGATPERLWVPIRDGVDRLGVLLFARSTIAEDLVRACEQLAALVAQFLVSKNQFTDEFEIARRVDHDMSLGAEVCWSLLPLSFSCDRVDVAAALEPAYDVCGDAFDYALNGDELSVAIFDGMGHELAAAQLTEQMVSAYRYCRRRSLSLVATYECLDGLLQDPLRGDRFVTAEFATLDTRRGTLRILNAGHPGPLLIRNGRRTKLREHPRPYLLAWAASVLRRPRCTPARSNLAIDCFSTRMDPPRRGRATGHCSGSPPC